MKKLLLIVLFLISSFSFAGSAGNSSSSALNEYQDPALNVDKGYNDAKYLDQKKAEEKRFQKSGFNLLQDVSQIFQVERNHN